MRHLDLDALLSSEEAARLYRSKPVLPVLLVLPVLEALAKM